MGESVKDEILEVVRGLMAMTAFVTIGVFALFLLGFMFGFFICGARIIGGF